MTDKDKKLAAEELKKVNGGTANERFNGVPYVDYQGDNEGPCINPDYKEATPPQDFPFFPPKFD